MMTLTTPIERLRGVTVRITGPLKTLGIRTIRDLLWHVPFRYDDFSRITKIASVTPGETVTVRGKIERVENTRTWRRKMFVTKAVITDQSGAIDAVWFNQPFLVQNLRVGKTASFSGKCARSDKGRAYLQNPAYEILDDLTEHESEKTTHTGRLVPVYPETRGITSRWLRYLIKNALAGTNIAESLPADILKRQKLPPLPAALAQIHFPAHAAAARSARHRLAFEELFFLNLTMASARKSLGHMRAPAMPLGKQDIETVKSFLAALPFSLTTAQKRSLWEIVQDMAKNTPMNRLLEGDVGSGKTVVAASACYHAATHGWQTALMAPTEVLAHQHFRSFVKLFAHGRISVGLLTAHAAHIYDPELGMTYGAKKQEFLKLIRTGNIAIVVGTHALIASGVAFRNVGLVVLDEQHRFGVVQRAALAQGNPEIIPHFLSMTATPIPRTLALTVYGDLDISLLDEMPNNRKKIITRIVAPRERAKAYEFLRQQARAGRQIFVICPRIEPPQRNTEESQNTAPLFAARTRTWNETKAVKEEYEKLHTTVFPDLTIAMLHGKMPAKEKESVMREFKEGTTNILVSTSVVEVGVDIPNASIMMIEGADRFGLAQLHQFRGRVGRGEHQSYCLLFPESDAPTENRRLKALAECDNGFELAEKDLAIRGPGDFLGGRQSGLPDLAMASLADAPLIKATRDETARLLEKDPTLSAHPKIKQRIAEFRKRVHLE